MESYTQDSDSDSHDNRVKKKNRNNIDEITKMLSPKEGFVLIKCIRENNAYVKTIILKINSASNKDNCMPSQTELFGFNEENRKIIKKCLEGPHYLLRIDIIDEANEANEANKTKIDIDNIHREIKNHIEILNTYQIPLTIPVTISETYISIILEENEHQTDFLKFLFETSNEKIRMNSYSLIPDRIIEELFMSNNLTPKKYLNIQKQYRDDNRNIIGNLFDSINKNKKMLVSIIDYSNRSQTFYSYLKNINYNDDDYDKDEDDKDENNEGKKRKRSDDSEDDNNKKIEKYIHLKNNLLAFYISLFKYKGIVSFDGHLNNMLININGKIVIIDFEQFKFFGNITFEQFNQFIEKNREKFDEIFHKFFNENPLIQKLFEINKSIKPNEILDKDILEDLIILLFVENISFAINHENGTKFKSYLQILLLNYENDIFPTKTNYKVFLGKELIEQIVLINTLTELSKLKAIYFPEGFVPCDLYNSLRNFIFSEINSKESIGGLKKTRKYRKTRTQKTAKTKYKNKPQTKTNCKKTQKKQTKNLKKTNRKK